MKNEEVIAKKKFKIIEPFFNKEKKLKEIEKETDISYATLKRWVRAYKKEGIEGLNKKERVDKNNYKKIDNSELGNIKNFYLKNNALSISKLYENYSSFAEKLNISYPTFYRIINNLDNFVKKSSEFHMKKIEKYGASYGLFQYPLYFQFNSKKIFYITLLFEISTLRIIYFYFDKEAKTFKKLFPFIRESILKIGVYPKEIFLTDTILEVSKNTLRQCFFESSINFITDEEFDYSELKKFCGFIQEDLSHEFYGQKDLEEINIQEFLENYIFIEKEEKKDLEFDLIRKLDFFMLKSNRKVHKYGIRLKRFTYYNQMLENYLNEVLEIKHNPFNDGDVVIYDGQEFLCTASKY